MSVDTTFYTSYANREYENYSPIAFILDYSDFEKGEFRKESQKFIFNGKNAYQEIYLVIHDSLLGIEVMGAYFNNEILMNPVINSKSYNPKVLAFVYIFCVTRIFQTGKLFLIPEIAQKLVKMLLQYEKSGTLQFENIVHSKIPILKNFIKDNGITSHNIIRYIHFFEKILSPL